MTLYFSKIIYNNSLNKCIFGLNLLALLRCFLARNWRGQECIWELKGTSWKHWAAGPGWQHRGAPSSHHPQQKCWGAQEAATAGTEPQGRSRSNGDQADGNRGKPQSREEKDGYSLSTLLERDKFMTGFETGAQRGRAGSRKLRQDRFLDGTGALEITEFKTMKSEVIFFTLPSKLQEIHGDTVNSPESTGTRVVLARVAKTKNWSCYGIKACPNTRKEGLSKGKSPREARLEKTSHEEGLLLKAVNSGVC